MPCSLGDPWSCWARGGGRDPLLMGHVSLPALSLPGEAHGVSILMHVDVLGHEGMHE